MLQFQSELADLQAAMDSHPGCGMADCIPTRI